MAVARRTPGRNGFLALALSATLAACAPQATRPAIAVSGRSPTWEPALDTTHSRGWNYLVDRLVADGLNRRQVARVFADPRFPPFDGVEFSIPARRKRGGGGARRGRYDSVEVAGARQCLARHRPAARLAEATTGVPGTVVASILQVETGCGRNTGSHRVLPALAKLAMANEPGNLAFNLAVQGDPANDADFPGGNAAGHVRSRAKYLEKTFYPEVKAVFEVARRTGIDPLELRGSFAGAFGLPQFLPTSYLSYGRDGDGDGRVNLHDPDDAIVSCATYLAANGWRPGVDDEGKRKVIWHYNHSTAYVDKVLGIAGAVARAEDGGDAD